MNYLQEDFTKAFNRGNLKIHLVEDQWHYTVFTRYNWIPETKSAQGFVRSYTYFHPELDKKITFTTGSHCDYFQDNGEVVYARSLEEYLITLNKLNI